jgi:isorenieratene synthase
MPTLVSQVEQLQVADPFAVGRFWFDRDFDWEHSWFTSLSGYRLTDSITLYHRIQDDYIAWAERTGGSVVELHAYCYKETEFPTQEDLLDTFEAELYTIVPALQGATVLHRQLVNQKNFAGFPPGSFANRPRPPLPPLTTCCLRGLGAHALSLWVDGTGREQRSVGR